MSARILVIDDTAVLLRSLVSLLRSLGYQAEGVEDVEAGLQRLQAPRAPCEAVLLDYSLEGTDGCALADRIWALHPGLPVVLMSGWDPSLLEDANDRPFAGFLHKPFLAEEVDRALLLALRDVA